MKQLEAFCYFGEAWGWGKKFLRQKPAGGIYGHFGFLSYGCSGEVVGEKEGVKARQAGKKFEFFRGVKARGEKFLASKR